MKPNEAGYATAGVITLMAVLSLVTSSLLNMALTENKRADTLINRAQLDARLKQTVMQEIAHYLSVDRYPNLKTKAVEIDGVAIEIAVSDEQARLDLNRSDFAELSSGLMRVFEDPNSASALLNHIRAARERSQMAFESLDELRGWPKLSRQEASCLSGRFSIYRSSLNPLVVTRREAQAFSMVGAILRIDARRVDKGKAPRGLQAVVLLTGDHKKPYRLMEWRRYSDYAAENCPGF